MPKKKKENSPKVIKTPKPPKIKLIQPVTPKKEGEEADIPKTKKSIIVHKTEKPVENLYQLLGETERTIAELSRIYAELPESRHYGVGGRMKPTDKQEMIAEQLRQTQARAEKLIKMIDEFESI